MTPLLNTTLCPQLSHRHLLSNLVLSPSPVFWTFTPDLKLLPASSAKSKLGPSKWTNPTQRINALEPELFAYSVCQIQRNTATKQHQNGNFSQNQHTLCTEKTQELKTHLLRIIRIYSELPAAATTLPKAAHTPFQQEAHRAQEQQNCATHSGMGDFSASPKKMPVTPCSGSPAKRRHSAAGRN